MTDLNEIVSALRQQPPPSEAWGAVAPAIERLSRRVLGHLADKRPDVFEEVVEGVIEKAQTRLLLGVGLGEQPRAFVAQMLRHAAADAQRRRTAFGGARQRMSDHEAEQRAVEQSPTGHRFPSPDEGLRQRELLVAVEAVLEQALAQRQPRYRSDLQDAWDFAHRRAVEGRSIRAQVEAERPELDADGLRKETERRTRAGQRLRDLLLEVAEGPAPIGGGGAQAADAGELLLEYLRRLAGCPGGGERGVSDLDPVEPGGEPPEDES